MSGALPIPISEIEAYCRLADVEDRMSFLRVIRQLDMGFLALEKKTLTTQETS